MSILAKRQGSLHPRNVSRKEAGAVGLSLDVLPNSIYSCILICSIQQRQHSWRTTRLAEQTRYSMFRVHHFNNPGLQRSRESAIMLVKRQGTFSMQEDVQRRVADSSQKSQVPSSRFQSEKSRSKVPVMRQQAESSSIEACAYLNSLAIN
jgi:hypothetical protein